MPQQKPLVTPRVKRVGAAPGMTLMPRKKTCFTAALADEMARRLRGIGGNDKMGNETVDSKDER